MFGVLALELLAVRYGDGHSLFSSQPQHQSRTSNTLTIRRQMFKSMRRGPTSIVQLLRFSSSLSRCSSSSVPRIPNRLGCYGNPNVATRAFSFRAPLRQHAAARVVDAEIEQDVNAQQPPSDNQINEATRHGPVTKFQELSDRSMVCSTLVKTITKDMGLETMTQVQSMTINETLKGIDV